MVQATQPSYLPDPYDRRPVEQGIGVCFTECNIGGLSIAVIEDRKFKSAPKPLFPEADLCRRQTSPTSDRLSGSFDGRRGQQ